MGKAFRQIESAQNIVRAKHSGRSLMLGIWNGLPECFAPTTAWASPPRPKGLHFWQIGNGIIS